MRKLLMMCFLIMVFVFGGLKILKSSIKDDLRTGLQSDFALSDTAADFALECVRNKNDFGYDEVPTVRRFCGCVGSGIAETLSDRDLEIATFLYESNRENGIAIPTPSTARTDSARRVATALETSMASCHRRIDQAAAQAG